MDRVQRNSRNREVQGLKKGCPRLCRKSYSSFCVRGEVPMESDVSGNRCGCTAIVLCGVRMKVPEKVFARSFVEASSLGLLSH